MQHIAPRSKQIVTLKVRLGDGEHVNPGMPQADSSGSPSIAERTRAAIAS
jgi:hypothetical protein